MGGWCSSWGHTHVVGLTCNNKLAVILKVDINGSRDEKNTDCLHGVKHYSILIQV